MRKERKAVEAFVEITLFTVIENSYFMYGSMLFYFLGTDDNKKKHRNNFPIFEDFFITITVFIICDISHLKHFIAEH